MNNVPTPANLRNVEFQIEKEDWNTYELKDGVKIKGRLIAVRLVRENNMPPGQYGVQTQNLFATFAPDNLKGAPANLPQSNQIDPSKLYPVEVIHSDEVWNIYHIPSTGDRIKVKLVATEIFRAKDVYDQLGEPYYVITSGIMVSPISKGLSA